MKVKLLFSEYFDIPSSVMEQYGAFNICIESDFPLFIDPFLLFASEKTEYKELHKKIVQHLFLLKEMATGSKAPDHNLFKFPEISQNWLGWCNAGNKGRGLGIKFAKDLVLAFNGFYSSFGEESISSESHIEKLTLVGDGIGRDFISDFTVNLMFEYLLEYTQRFAQNYLEPAQTKEFSVRCHFDEKLMVWLPKSFILPYFYRENGDFILLTPIDILTKDESFICHNDLKNNFRKITNALQNASLRDSINLFFQRSLPTYPKKEDFELAVDLTIKQFPDILDYYIKYKEDKKDDAAALSTVKVNKFVDELIVTLQQLCKAVADRGDFFTQQPSSYDEALKRAYFLKDTIESNDIYKIFYKDGIPIAHEDTIQRIFRLTWFASPFDVNSEVNNGRGPADYKISFGDDNSAIVEFKLGGSTSLKRNLLKQVEIYKKASRSTRDIKVILCYTNAEITKVEKILKEVGLYGAENIIIIDATIKISASKA